MKIIPPIKQITSIFEANAYPNGRIVFGLGEDSQVYFWRWEKGEWELWKK